MKMRDAIIEAVRRADDHVRQYGASDISMAELYADKIIESVQELSGAEDVENLLTEHARYRRALEYISKAPVSTETEIVLQGRAIIGLLDKGVEVDDD